MEKQRILLVNSNEKTKKLWKSLEEKYNIDYADKFPNLDFLQQSVIDIVVSDAFTVRADVASSEIGIMKHLFIPLVVYAPKKDEKECLSCLTKGADDFILEPFTRHEIDVKIQTHLKLVALWKIVTKEKADTENPLNSIFQHAPVAIAVVEGPLHVYSFANPLYQRLFNRSESQLIGYNIREVFPEIEGQGIYEIFENVYSSGESFVGDDLQATFYRQEKDLFETGYFNFVAQPIKGSHGKVEKIIIIAYETSNQVFASNALKRTEVEQRFLSEATKLLFSSLDYKVMLKGLAESAIPILCDYCFVDILSSGGTLKRVAWAHKDPGAQKKFEKIYRFVPQLDRKQHPIIKALESGKLQTLENITLGALESLASGEEHFDLMRDLHFHCAIFLPLTLENKTLGVLTFSRINGSCYSANEIQLAGELAGRVTLAVHHASLYEHANQEINERRRTEQQLKFLERQKDYFLSAASHELKTPVTSIKGHVQLLEEIHREKGDEQTARQLKRVDIQIDKLIKIIRDLLSVSRIQTGKFEFEQAEFDFDVLVQESVDSLRAIGSSHDLLLMGSSFAKVSGDRDKIEQVILNLVGNAIKYSPAGEKVILEIETDGKNVILSVTDFGVGISKDDLLRIFERFYSVKGKNFTTGGLGIGLYISSEIIKGHNGKIWASSKLGEGSVFSLSLPLVRQPSIDS